MTFYHLFDRLGERRSRGCFRRAYGAGLGV